VYISGSAGLSTVHQPRSCANSKCYYTAPAAGTTPTNKLYVYGCPDEAQSVTTNGSIPTNFNFTSSQCNSSLGTVTVNGVAFDNVYLTCYDGSMCQQGLYAVAVDGDKYSSPQTSTKSTLTTCSPASKCYLAQSTSLSQEKNKFIGAFGCVDKSIMVMDTANTTSYGNFLVTSDMCTSLTGSNTYNTDSFSYSVTCFSAGGTTSGAASSTTGISAILCSIMAAAGLSLFML